MPKPVKRRGMIPEYSPLTPSSRLMSNNDCNTKLNLKIKNIHLYRKNIYTEYLY